MNKIKHFFMRLNNAFLKKNFSEMSMSGLFLFRLKLLVHIMPHALQIHVPDNICFNFTYDTFGMSKWVMVDLIKHFFMAYAFSDMNKSAFIILSL